MSCERIKIKRRKICIGDLKHKIKIHTVSSNASDTVDFSRTFTLFKEVWGAIQTSDKGVELFDGVNVIGVATHFFYIKFLSGVTSEKYIEYQSNYYRILEAENLDQRSEYFKLKCTTRGVKTTNANKI